MSVRNHIKLIWLVLTNRMRVEVRRHSASEGTSADLQPRLNNTEDEMQTGDFHEHEPEHAADGEEDVRVEGPNGITADSSRSRRALR